MFNSSFVQVLNTFEDSLEASFGVFLVEIGLPCRNDRISECTCLALGVLNDKVKLLLFDELLHDNRGLRDFDALY